MIFFIVARLEQVELLVQASNELMYLVYRMNRFQPIVALSWRVRME